MSTEASEGPSTSASPSKEKMDAKLKATNLLAQGKRNMVCQEVPSAVQQFQDACQLLSSAYGEMAVECADAYFQYGSALLELSRMEQGVLGNALDGVDVDADDDGEPNDKEQFEPTEKLGEDSSKKEKDGEKTEDTEEGEEGEGEEEEEEEEEGDEEEGDESQEEEKKEGEEDPEDISNLQLAWEVLELSKIIYSKDSSKESQLKAAESSLKLGEVSLETEQYDKAVSDLEICLKIQKEHLEPFDRAIAETHYQLGLACHMDKQYNSAIENFKSAVSCLEKKIEQLQAIVKENPPKEPADWVDPAENAAKEIKDIESILPEIREKITDAEDESKTLDVFKTMAKEAVGSAFSAVGDSAGESGFGSSNTSSSSLKSPAKEDKKTSDISHLIRKKRKTDEEENREDLENKKPKQEVDESDNPAVNGHAEKSGTTLEATAAT